MSGDVIKFAYPVARGAPPEPSIATARRDTFSWVLIICAAVVLLFHGDLFVRSLSDGPAVGLATRNLGVALILNVALLLLAWRRMLDLAWDREQRLRGEDQATLLAATDSLTGLLNRQGFVTRAAELDHKATARGDRLSVFSIQLHRFKSISDCHGIEVGEVVLRRIADRLTKALADHGAIARLAIDEFAIAVIHAEGAHRRIEAAGHAILDAVIRPQEHESKVIQVGAFVGIAVRDDDALTIADLMRRADIALEHARTVRAAGPVWFDQAMERALIAQNDMEQGIRLGIKRGEFIPYFEPQVDLASGTIIGFEALARWHHPTAGIIMPDAFIAIAEQNGLIGPLSEQVMRGAFAEAAQWPPSLSLSVNVSPMQLADSWFAQHMIRLLAQTGFPANRLIVEITESSLFADMEQARTIVTSLKNQGIRLALDDFGTGFSSLSNLRSLPFDMIKIDRSFTSTLHRDGGSEAIVRAVTTLASALDVPVTIEGIEDAATEAAVLGMGCTIGQGWLYGKPVAAEQARALLRTGVGQSNEAQLSSVG